MDSSFPKGPANFQDLFQWADYNTSILMDNDQAKQRFIDLLSSVDQVVLHEDFAGSFNVEEGTEHCRTLKQLFGKKLLDEYMKVLDDETQFLESMKCYKMGHKSK
ncbi:unnamed protein product, partial [Durusdinium trenchii]